jgi:hypothetical protein
MLLYLQFEVTRGWVLKSDMEIAPCGVVFISFNLKKVPPRTGKSQSNLF